MSGYRVSLDAFEGPLDLLLYLVKHDEVDIYDISLERITRQFLEFIEQARELDIPVAGEFIVMAAQLIYLKSRELLPQHVLPPEEDLEEDDPRWDLIRQLLEYKKFKDIAAHLGRSETERALLYPPRPINSQPGQPEEAPLELELTELLEAFQRVLSRASAVSQPRRILDDRWTVPEKIQSLREAIRPGDRLRFSALFRGDATREELIVTFLALLELMKIREIRASQVDFLGDIDLQRL